MRLKEADYVELAGTSAAITSSVSFYVFGMRDQRSVMFKGLLLGNNMDHINDTIDLDKQPYIYLSERNRVTGETDRTQYFLERNVNGDGFDFDKGAHQLQSFYEYTVELHYHCSNVGTTKTQWTVYELQSVGRNSYFSELLQPNLADGERRTFESPNCSPIAVLVLEDTPNNTPAADAA